MDKPKPFKYIYKSTFIENCNDLLVDIRVLNEQVKLLANNINQIIYQ